MTSMQRHFTTTALQHITEDITTGFSKKRPPLTAIAIALDMSKTFDAVNQHTFINKLSTTTTEHTTLKYRVGQNRLSSFEAK
jgi:hypothetical protein